jgi:hypothetical protein
MAVRGALRCDVTTDLAGDEVVRIFSQTMARRSKLKEHFVDAARWNLITPPPGCHAAAELVRNPRQERAKALNGFTERVGGARFGTVIALGFNKRDGRTSAQMFTSTTMKAENGKVWASGDIRKQMKLVADQLVRADPSAEVKHWEDPE